MNFRQIKTLSLSLICFINIVAQIRGDMFGAHQWRNFEESRYTTHASRNKIPTLEKLFQKTSYRDPSNHSSPCKHKDRRNTLCHKIITFDQEGYERSLQETRRLILSRLNLDSEPTVKISHSAQNFLDQIENKILNSQATASDKSSTVKSKYDIKSPQNKLYNSMHEASSISDSCFYTSEPDKLCISFEIPIKSLLHRKPSSIVLWLNIKQQQQSETNNLRLHIYDLNKHANNLVNDEEIKSGWNTIDITSIFRMPAFTNKNAHMNFTIVVKCAYECSIGLTDFESSDETRSILINNSPGKKPILSINLEDSEESSDSRSNKRNKRAVRAGHSSHYKQQNGNEPKYCHKSSSESDRECCLVSYFIDFRALKWNTWIISPNGFTANYCYGKCNDKKSKFI